MSLNDSSTYSLQIVQGSSAVTFTYPNLFTLSLPSSGYTAGRDEIALKSLNVYYSWPNISAAKGNNQWSYSYLGVTYPIVMADGIFSFVDLLSYIQQVMIQNGHYLVNAFGEKVFYLSFVANPVYYCLSLTATPVPTSLPASWTNPGSMNLSGNTFQLNVPAGMTILTGFAVGSYPPVAMTTLYQVNSGTPQITDTTSINITSNIVNSSAFSLSSNILASFVVPNGQVPGSQIQYAPNNIDWVGMQVGVPFTQITVAVVDQLKRPVVLRDPTGFLAILNIRKRVK